MKAILWAGFLVALASPAWCDPVGQFTDHRDIGGPAHAGSTSYDAGTDTYTVTGGGGNMWADRDSFQFAWKTMSGDVAISTDVDFVSPKPAPSAGGYIHRKGGVIIRQDLDPDSVYVDALRMSNDQLSLQYREVKGGQTRLIWINTPYLGAVKLEKIGDYAYLSVPGPDGKLHHAGGSFKLKINGPYYIGLGVCAHDNSTAETMAFRHLKITPLKAGTAKPKGMTLQTIQIANPAEQTALAHAAGAISVLGWSADGKSVVYRQGGGVYQAVSWDSSSVGKAAADRTAAVLGTKGVSPDGQWVYSSAPFDGKMKLWRAHPDGSGRMQVTSGDTSDFDPYPSPDGKWLAYISAPAGEPKPGFDVMLQLMPLSGGLPDAAKTVALVKLVGGKTTLNASAWSPDSKTLAFLAQD